jgi:hypothetical protein
METKKQVQKILVLYQEKLKKKVFGKEIFSADSLHPSQHQSLLHAKWMIEQALLFLENPKRSDGLVSFREFFGVAESTPSMNFVTITAKIFRNHKTR